jgi:hypothetical protein
MAPAPPAAICSKAAFIRLPDRVMKVSPLDQMQKRIFLWPRAMTPRSTFLAPKRNRRTRRCAKARGSRAKVVVGHGLLAEERPAAASRNGRRALAVPRPAQVPPADEHQERTTIRTTIVIHTTTTIIVLHSQLPNAPAPPPHQSITRNNVDATTL